MTTLQALRSRVSQTIAYPWQVPLALGAILSLLVVLFVLLIRVAPQENVTYHIFLFIWLFSFLPYLGGCFLVMRTKASGRYSTWLEWGILFGGAVILRVMLLTTPPNLSHDSWRYLWDARVTLLGYSPYVYVPFDQAFVHLRDVIFANSRFRNVPTIYPPGAQAIYLLSYLLRPGDLVTLKAIFMLFDLASCGLLALLLKKRGSDPRRFILYAWCPLPIVEFAIQGHVDVLAITYMLLAILCNQGTKPVGRALTGFFVAMATLIKFYPLLLLAVVVRRREWLVLLTFLMTILLSYLPFLILGHGQVLGYFSQYASEQGGNAGPINLLGYWVGLLLFQQNLKLIVLLQTMINLLVVGASASFVLWLRWSKRIDEEMASLLLIATVLACSSHIFPWYTSALVPWVVGGVGPLRIHEEKKRGTLKFQAKGIAMAAAWYFPCASVFMYFCGTANDWYLYYTVVYGGTLVVLGLALFSHRLNSFQKRI